MSEIEHIVVLMMENHSYDNYFGWIQGHGDGFQRDAAGHPVPNVPNLDANGVPVPLSHRPTTKQQPDVPTQSWAASHIQLGHESNDGFVRSVDETVPGEVSNMVLDHTSVLRLIEEVWNLPSLTRRDAAGRGGHKPVATGRLHPPARISRPTAAAAAGDARCVASREPVREVGARLMKRFSDGAGRSGLFRRYVASYGRERSCCDRLPGNRGNQADDCAITRSR